MYSVHVYVYVCVYVCVYYTAYKLSIQLPVYRHPASLVSRRFPPVVCCFSPFMVTQRGGKAMRWLPLMTDGSTCLEAETSTGKALSHTVYE